VDFILTTFGLIAVFTSALTVISNLYLKTVLTNVATDAARQLARADQSANPASAVTAAEKAIHSVVGESLQAKVVAKTEKQDGLALSVVTVNANLPGFSLFPELTSITTTAHATLEIQ